MYIVIKVMVRHPISLLLVSGPWTFGLEPHIKDFTVDPVPVHAESQYCQDALARSRPLAATGTVGMRILQFPTLASNIVGCVVGKLPLFFR